MIRQQRFKDSWTSERCEPMLAKAMFHGLSFATQRTMNSTFWGRDLLILEKGGIHLSAPAYRASDASASRHGLSSGGRVSVPGSVFGPVRPVGETFFGFESTTSDR